MNWYHGEVKRIEELEAFVATMKIVSDPDAAAIAIACRLAGKKNFALISADLGTGKRLTLLEHLGRVDRILVLCPPHMIRLWIDAAEDTQCKATAMSYHRIARRNGDPDSLKMVKEFDRIVIDDAHGPRTCDQLAKVVKSTKRQTIYVGTAVGDPMRALRSAVKITGRDWKNCDWIVVPNANIHRFSRSL